MTAQAATAVFTVTRRGPRKGRDPIMTGRYMLTVDLFPDRQWGPYSFRDMSDELYVAALVSRVQARNVILDAFALGTASITGSA